MNMLSTNNQKSKKIVPEISTEAFPLVTNATSSAQTTHSAAEITPFTVNVFRLASGEFGSAVANGTGLNDSIKNGFADIEGISLTNDILRYALQQTKSTGFKFLFMKKIFGLKKEERKDYPVVENIEVREDVKQIHDSLKHNEAFLMSKQNLNILLFYAARFGDVKAMKDICATGVNVNIQDDKGKTPITYAAIGNHSSCVSILKNNGAIIDVPDLKGRTALHWSSFYGNSDAVKSLLNYNASTITKDASGKTALHLSAMSENSDALHILLRHSLNDAMNQLDEEKMTPVMWAALCGNESCLHLFLNYDANVFVKGKSDMNAFHFLFQNRTSRCCSLMIRYQPSLMSSKDVYGRTLLHLVAAEGNITVLQYLIEVGCNVHEQDSMKRIPLHWAAVNGHSACVTLLSMRSTTELDSKDDVGATALHYACLKGHFDCAMILLKKGADVDMLDKKGETSSMWAAKGNKIDMLKMLLSYEADFANQDYEGNSVLHIFAQTGSLEGMSILLRKDVNVDVENDKKETPLHVAVKAGRHDLCHALINEGASINVVDANGKTPLYYAIQKKHTDIVKLLLNSGAAVNISDKAQMTPLHISSEAGNIVFVELLLRYGADVNSVDKNKITPLHIACLKGHFDVCRCLLLSNAKLNPLSADVRTPLDYAISVKKEDCQRLLKMCGALTSTTLKNWSAIVLQKFFTDLKNRQHGLQKQNRKIKNPQAPTATNDKNDMLENQNDGALQSRIESKSSVNTISAASSALNLSSSSNKNERKQNNKPNFAYQKKQIENAAASIIQQSWKDFKRGINTSQSSDIKQTEQTETKAKASSQFMVAKNVKPPAEPTKMESMISLESHDSLCNQLASSGSQKDMNDSDESSKLSKSLLSQSNRSNSDSSQNSVASSSGDKSKRHHAVKQSTTPAIRPPGIQELNTKSTSSTIKEHQAESRTQSKDNVPPVVSATATQQSEIPKPILNGNGINLKSKASMSSIVSTESSNSSVSSNNNDSDHNSDEEVEKPHTRTYSNNAIVHRHGQHLIDASSVPLPESTPQSVSTSIPNMVTSDAQNKVTSHASLGSQKAIGEKKLLKPNLAQANSKSNIVQGSAAHSRVPNNTNVVKDVARKSLNHSRAASNSSSKILNSASSSSNVSSDQTSQSPSRVASVTNMIKNTSLVSVRKMNSNSDLKDNSSDSSITTNSPNSTTTETKMIGASVSNIVAHIIPAVLRSKQTSQQALLKKVHKSELDVRTSPVTGKATANNVTSNRNFKSEMDVTSKHNTRRKSNSVNEPSQKLQPRRPSSSHSFVQRTINAFTIPRTTVLKSSPEQKITQKSDTMPQLQQQQQQQQQQPATFVVNRPKTADPFDHFEREENPVTNSSPSNEVLRMGGDKQSLEAIEEDQIVTNRISQVQEELIQREVNLNGPREVEKHKNNGFEESYNNEITGHQAKQTDEDTSIPQDTKEKEEDNTDTSIHDILVESHSNNKSLRLSTEFIDSLQDQESEIDQVEPKFACLEVNVEERLFVVEPIKAEVHEEGSEEGEEQDDNIRHEVTKEDLEHNNHFGVVIKFIHSETNSNSKNGQIEERDKISESLPQNVLAIESSENDSSLNEDKSVDDVKPDLEANNHNLLEEESRDETETYAPPEVRDNHVIEKRAEKEEKKITYEQKNSSEDTNSQKVEGTAAISTDSTVGKKEEYKKEAVTSSQTNIKTSSTTADEVTSIRHNPTESSISEINNPKRTLASMSRQASSSSSMLSIKRKSSEMMNKFEDISFNTFERPGSVRSKSGLPMTLSKPSSNSSSRVFEQP